MMSILMNQLLYFLELTLEKCVYMHRMVSIVRYHLVVREIEGDSLSFHSWERKTMSLFKQYYTMYNK